MQPSNDIVYRVANSDSGTYCLYHVINYLLPCFITSFIIISFNFLLLLI
uniref:Uncharacterized protein n=1 Tax=Arundo donax TaxID=35708 RepID=A0A0A9EX00_ARUDO